MANFFSASQEEQQEILLTFWDKFKYLFIVGLIAIILFISGRDYFVSSTNKEDLLKATLYQTYLESDGQDDGKILLESYPDSIYSDFVRLNEAKKSFLNGNNEFNPIFASAQTRLAKIYLEDKNYVSAIATLNNSEELTSTMLELKGDAENGLGEYQSARTSYMLALQNSTNQASRALINMKISDLEGENLE